MLSQEVGVSEIATSVGVSRQTVKRVKHSLSEAESALALWGLYALKCRLA
jgi:predicted DNA-binding protein YlxM (UPF0122 family)